MRGIRVLLVIVACLTVVVPAGSARKRGPSGPDRSVIVKHLKAHYLGDDPINYPTTRYSYTVGSIARGNPRLGTYLADGTPPNSKTTVFPIHVISTRKVVYSDGSRTITRYDAKYVFFRDEFHEWTFTIKSENAKVSH